MAPNGYVAFGNEVVTLTDGKKEAENIKSYSLPKTYPFNNNIFIKDITYINNSLKEYQ